MIHSECATPVHLFRSLCAGALLKSFEGRAGACFLCTPHSFMGWGCCRRRFAGEKETAPEPLLAAPHCPQNPSPGGSVFQRCQATGILRRHLRTSSEELDRFRLEAEASQASPAPVRGSWAWWSGGDQARD